MEPGSDGRWVQPGDEVMDDLGPEADDDPEAVAEALEGDADEAARRRQSALHDEAEHSAGRCPRCRADVEPDMKRCPVCDQLLVATSRCPVCGAQVDDLTPYCPDCGTPNPKYVRPIEL